MPILAPLFLVTALLYAAAGFGGGSTYTALLALRDPDPQIVPIVSLTCNILVVAICSWRFARAGHVDLGRIWPLFAASVPMAFVGGLLPVPRLVFVGLLAASLIVAGIVMLVRTPVGHGVPRRYPRWLEPVVGSALGLLAGIVGIGGGIYLAPILYLLRWARPHAIAGTCAVFILVNSLAGLAGQAAKAGGGVGDILAAHWLLFPAVAIGGLIGSAIGSRGLPARPLQIFTALMILLVAGHLAVRLAQELAGA